MSKNNKNFFRTKNSWSEIKDQLLGCYLRPYFQKVLMNYKPICYVDCFAGQGKFDDGKPGSPLIALEARDKCLDSTKRKDINNAIKIFLIEPNHTEKLKENVNIYNNKCGIPVIISGKYEEEIQDILLDKQGNNVFLYIDPYGIRALDYSLFKIFGDYGFHSFELLINFNSFGFFRDACRAMGVSYANDEALSDLDDLVEYDPTEVSFSQQSTELLSKIAGGEYWKDIVSQYNRKEINGYRAERMFSTEYKSRLKKIFNYVLDLPIRLKPGHRPKYRMIHACNHEDGCFLMAENMQRRKDELFIKIQQNQQGTLLNLLTDMSSTAENELISVEEINKLVIGYCLQVNKEINLTKFLAGFLNQYGLICDFGILHSVLSGLEKCGLIKIVRIPETTLTGKESSFWTEKGSRQVFIRRMK